MFQSSDVFVDFDCSADTMIEGEERFLFLSLMSSSSISADFLQLVLLYHNRVTVEEWFRHLTSVRNPERFFIDDFVEDFANDGNWKIQNEHSIPFSFENNSSNHRGFTSSLPKGFTVTPALTSTALCREVQPTSRSPRLMSFQNVRLMGGETLRIPVKCHAMKDVSECVAL